MGSYFRATVYPLVRGEVAGLGARGSGLDEINFKKMIPKCYVCICKTVPNVR